MRVLLATDGSAYSEDAARFLTRFAFTPNDEIIVLHVVTDIPYDDDYKAQIRHYFRKISPEIRRASLDVLKPLKAKIASLEEEGVAEETIRRVAVDSGVDLIVMGARGVKGLKSYFIGSVTRSVATMSPKPVLITKPYQVEARETMRVLFATDGSPSADATASFLATVPFPPNTELLLMHAVPRAAADIPERFVAGMSEIEEAVMQRGREKADVIFEKAKTLLSARFGEVRTVVKTGDPSLEILSKATAWNADIIAAGSRGLRGIRGILGSVSMRILGHSPCPVLIGKSGSTA